ncbi:hypothetical protein MUK42_13905 [Musa troglodytarum]|uniref:Uncharacterized protein n=1 Tax=Musa troglodytarum TaxID=320322 RepID=A0A9E7IEI8_9LILI|nr:hypothetical protein MUK42_33073 [Musa troglodytarum]URE48519.1 hypothetical protein MUK42_13905 [Musa troglodytarum]
MVASRAIGFRRLPRGFHGRRPPSSVLNPHLSRINPNSRVPDTSFPPSSTPKSVSAIAGIEPAHIVSRRRSLYSIFSKPKPGSVSGVDVPSKSDVTKKKGRKSTPLSSWPTNQPMVAKEFPKELSPEAAALVSRLQEGGYLTKANFYQVAPGSPEKVPATLYSRHILKSAAEKFGQDHQDIAKWLSGRELKEIALFGCPSLDRKTVFAAKRLRSFFSIQEDIICRGCLMRTSCKFMNKRVSRMEKVVLSETMRILALFALDAVPTQLRIPCDLKSSVCKLLKEVVSLSA